MSNQSDMDAVLAYRNYLAAEDHLDELITRATDSEERAQLESMLDVTIALRDELMPPEVHPEKHCLVKHYAVAYEAVRERWKALKTEQLYWQKKEAYGLLISALEMLWDRKIITCERCKHGDERNSEGSGGDTPGGTEYGEPRGIIQTVSLGGGLSLYNGEETGGSWDGTGGSRGSAIQSKSRSPDASDGDTAGEINTNRLS